MTDHGRILKILREQVSGYSRLYGLLKREKEAVISFDPLAVESLAKEKDILALQLKLLEEERKRLTEEFFSGRSGGTISDLYAVTGDEAFLEVRSRLLSLVQGIGELNDLNRLLIDRASTHLRAAAAFFQTFEVKTPPRTLSREA